jgi:hypothetical protein
MSETDSPDEALSVRARQQEDGDAADGWRVPEPEELAQAFHAHYENLAPDFGYETRTESAKPWNEVPEKNRALMIAVCATLLRCYSIRASLSSPPTTEETSHD